MSRSLLPLASLCLKLGEVDRATMHPDGRLETDTTHTVMLAVIACAVAAQHPELKLDLGMVAQLAIVHDLVEAHAGDTDTFLITAPGQHNDKAAREQAALERIAEDCRDYPWVARVIAVYEHQHLPEARFVRYLDKACPRLTNTLNRGAAVRARGQGREAMKARDDYLLQELEERYPEFAKVCGSLVRLAADEAEAAFEEG